jgi:hypothetical protein
MVSYSSFMVFPDRGLLNERHRYSPNGKDSLEPRRWPLAGRVHQQNSLSR